MSTPILRTKLNRPPVAKDHLHRQHLLDWLERRRQRPLTLVSAPAGYGKSTVVSCWLESCGVPSAWLSLDENDNDLRIFLSYFIAAIQTILPDAGRQMKGLINAAELPPLETVSSTLLNELDLLEKEFILVLDDYHLITDRAVQHLMIELIAHPSNAMHLVLITRRDPRLPLATLRARGLMTEIRVEELRFSISETAAFLNQAMGFPADEATAAALEKKTEGWVVGLRLAALSLRKRDNTEPFLKDLRGNTGYIMDYLVTEVVSQQPSAIQQYLLVTSILDRFCASLCEAVCVPSAEPMTCEMIGQEFLDWLGQANLFLIPLDNENRWFRYHHLFRQVLHSRLKSRYGNEEIFELHRRAGAWFAENSLIEESLRHNLAAKDIPAAATLIVQHRHDLINREQWHRLRSWLSMLPREVIEKDPELLLVEAWLLIGWSEMGDTMARIEALLTAMPPDATISKRLQGEFDTLRSLIHYHIADGANTRARAIHALKTLPPEKSSERGLATMLLALSYQMTGDLGKARSVVLQAIKEKDNHYDTFHGRVILTFCFMGYMAADLKDVMQAARQCLDFGQESGLAEIIAHGYYFLGICHYDRNDLAASRDCLAPVVKGPYIANLHNFTFSSFALALTYQAQGESAQARKVVEAVVKHALNIGNTSLLQTAQGFQAELAIRQDKIEEANHWAETYNPDPFYVAYRFYVPQMTMAKWLLFQGTTEKQQQAAHLLNRLEAFLRSTHNTRLLIEVLALKAMHFDVHGADSSAPSALEQSITLAQPGGFIRLFVDLGPHMADLLQRLPRKDVAENYIHQILAAFRNDKRSVLSDPLKSASPASQTEITIELLTNRELEILFLLAQRLRNKEIAEKLFISPDTVKRHTINLYAKLKVGSRQQAVNKAYALGILSDRRSSASV